MALQGWSAEGLGSTWRRDRAFRLFQTRPLCCCSDADWITMKSSHNRGKQRHLRTAFCRHGLISVPVIAWFLVSLRHLTSLRHAATKTEWSRVASQPLPPLVHPVASGRMLYVGQFGLGHRLSKLAAAVHLARQVPLTRVEVYFGHCKAANKTKEWDIFQHLFGTNMIDLGQSELQLGQPAVSHYVATDFASRSGRLDTATPTEKIILIRNDVRGYYAGQAYKNARSRLPRGPAAGVAPPLLRLPRAWDDKLESDVLLFRHLMRLFTSKVSDSYESFKQSLGDKFVIGLHVRAGNGEAYHFADANRGVVGSNDSTTVLQSFTERLVNLIAHAKSQLLESHGRSESHPVVIFLATDTPELIPIVMEAAQQFSISVVVFPQMRVRPNAGVSYAAWTEGQQCLEGWKASLMDMALLALRADVVVAAMRSTFTQIAPLALQFGALESQSMLKGFRSSLRFCEVSSDIRTMTCFASRTTWLLRQGGHGRSDIISISFDNNSTAISQATKPVPHKVMVHLPDVLQNDSRSEFEANLEKLRSFLNEPSGEQYFVLGDRFNSKYRSKNLTFQEDWA